MNYVYDILINLKYPLLDFYEWNDNDDIENVKRLPFYKISSEDLYNFKYTKFKIKDFESIKNGIKLFNNKKKTYHGAIYTDGNETVVICYDKNGISISKSSLLLDEEEEILNSSSILEVSKIDYEIISRDKINDFKTRKEKEITNYLIKEISKIDNIDKLNYINYECFNNEKVSKHELITKIKTIWDDKYYKIYDFLYSISMNKK